MARMISLLAYAWQNEHRRSNATRSGSFRTFALLVAAAALFGFVTQLKRIMFGPLSSRLQYAEYLTLVLAALWLLAPLSTRSSIPLSTLLGYPITTRQRLIYRILSYWRPEQTTMLVSASIVSVLALVRVPNSVLHMAQASACFILAAATGMASALLFSQIQNISSLHPMLSRARLKSRTNPFLRKEVSYFVRALDPYVALLISAGFGYSEYMASWLTPAKATIPLLLIVVLQLPAIVNPYALDSSAEMNRYRIIPLPPWRILACKHAALVIISLLTMSPLIAAMLLKMTFQQGFLTVIQLCVVIASWLCSGVLLLRSHESRHIQMAFGSLSGTGFSLGLFGLALCILVPPPVASAFMLRGEGSRLWMASTGLLCALSAIYVLALRASRAGWALPDASD